MDFLADILPFLITLFAGWAVVDFALICWAHKHFERRRQLERDDDEYFGLK